MSIRHDSHVHFYDASDLARVATQLPYALPQPHPLKAYLDQLATQGITPAIINHVHLSILPDSANVFRSFEEMATLRQVDAARYGTIQLVGTIKADPDYATTERLQHPRVKGIRIVLHTTPVEALNPDAYQDAAWQALYTRLRDDQHIHIYATSPATNLAVLKRIPPSITVAIDHLGTCEAASGAQASNYQALLAEAARRGNVFFKGPGYRTALKPEDATPFACEIARIVGADKLVLDATDAPHVGQTADATAYCEVFSPEKVFAFTASLAMNVAEHTNTTAESLLHGNLAALLNLHTTDSPS